MSLRRRLVLLLVALVVVGLAVSDVATYVSVGNFLNQRVDADVAVADQQASGMLLHAARGPRGAHLLSDLFGNRAPSSSPSGAQTPYERAESLFFRRFDDGISPAVYEVVVDRHGTVVLRHPSGSSDHPDPVPALPSPLPVSPLSFKLLQSHSGHVDVSPSGLFTMGSQGGEGLQYRAIAVGVPGGVLVVAEGLGDLSADLHRLLVIEIIVSCGVALVLAIGTLVVVRRGLRPLNRIARTAGAIAGGDLSRRVSPETEKTEIGRLGISLNTMLSQIERGFEDRRRSEERLRRFLADVSHELRTPLTSIQGYAELFHRGAGRDDAQVAIAMERIEREAGRMAVLVEDLLLLARLDAGRPLDLTDVDLVPLVAEAVEDAGVTGTAHPIGLEAPARLMVRGDEHRLRQVVSNLLANARVHTPPGTHVAVRLAREGMHALIEVHDDGPGFPGGTAERAFERFSSLVAGADPIGTGIGLSIVAAIARAHGGSAGIESPGSGGTTVRVELPVGGPVSDEGPADRAHGDGLARQAGLLHGGGRPETAGAGHGGAR